MHSRETARQRAEALFKPKSPAAQAQSPFDSIKAQAALAHSIGRSARVDRSVSASSKLDAPAKSDVRREV